MSIFNWFKKSSHPIIPIKSMKDINEIIKDYNDKVTKENNERRIIVEKDLSKLKNETIIFTVSDGIVHKIFYPKIFTYMNTRFDYYTGYISIDNKFYDYLRHNYEKIPNFTKNPWVKYEELYYISSPEEQINNLIYDLKRGMALKDNNKEYPYHSIISWEIV